ncbi:DUF1501 domain-containing protein [Carboxylicivirga marina]|uniref:DUF1501 domain-containing protein n=1 Tax=Carboxylicivirga marina TaxID=2800988 RepID=UPI002596750C|nr:DUF1501 domain-containing protein [uncultured Carboxylicivirga sp.]
MKRREFLHKSAIAGTTLMLPGFLQAFNKRSLNLNQNKLIIIQLAGGNDGLNTITPYRSDDYYKNRPSISLAKNKLLKVNDETGFHPSLQNLAQMFEKGEVSIVNQVGYPNQNKSHFRASDIWLTASDSQEYLQHGWLGRYLDAECQSPHDAIQSGTQLSLALKGEKSLGMAFTDARQLYTISNESFIHELSASTNDKTGELAYLYKTLTQTQQSTEYIFNTSKTYSTKTEYPKHKLAQSLKMIASLIGSNTETQIYYTEMGGFDTHTNQNTRQQQLLTQLDESLAALKKDLQQSNSWHNTLILVFSEFGRRISENGSKGTDHGKANNVWLLGGRLANPGFYNPISNLQLSEDNDLLHSVDFRTIYSSVIHDWLKSDYKSIVGTQFKPLSLI